MSSPPRRDSSIAFYLVDNLNQAETKLRFLIVVAIVGLLMGYCTTNMATQQWEYKVVRRDLFSSNSRIDVSKEVADGWEVVSSRSQEMAGMVVLRRSKR